MVNLAWRKRTRTPGFRTSFSVVLSVALLVATSAAAASGSDTTRQVTVQKWMSTYFTYLESHKLVDEGTFNTPMIWLFAPDGSLVRVATVNDDPDLEKLKALPFDTKLAPLPGQPSLTQANEMLKLALESEPGLAASKDTWHAVLFLSNSAGCKHCAAFDKGMKELEERMRGQLKAVRITILS